MLNIPINKPIGVYIFDGASPKREYGTETQQTNEAGMPIWSVSCFVRQADSTRSESITVNVPSRTNPADTIQPFSPVGFEGLGVRTGRSSNGSWVAFWADRIGVQSRQK